MKRIEILGAFLLLSYSPDIHLCSYNAQEKIIKIYGSCAYIESIVHATMSSYDTQHLPLIYLGETR